MELTVTRTFSECKCKEYFPDKQKNKIDSLGIL
jgi:hypothetical protein